MLPLPRRPTEKDCAARGDAVIAIAPNTILKAFMAVMMKSECLGSARAVVMSNQTLRYGSRHNCPRCHQRFSDRHVRLLHATHGEAETEKKRRRRQVVEVPRRRPRRAVD